MLNKKVIKDIQSLSLKKSRESSGLFVAEGPKIVTEFIELKPGHVEAVFATQEWASLHSGTQNMHIVKEDELERISHLQTPNQVIAVMKQFVSSEPVIRTGLAIYLDTIQDPGNLGTIIRIGDWFGIQDIICSSGCADKYNPKVVQSTMASLARVNVWYDLENMWLEKQSAPILAATLTGTSVYSYKLNGPAVLVIGNESRGIRKEIMDRVTNEITIPRKGEAESLNAAVAAGILLSHLIR
ncbi:MAG TPA: RNA methyltransferase [Chitinophagaceae bacterium]